MSKVNLIKSFDNNCLRRLSDYIATILTHRQIDDFFNTYNIDDCGGSSKTERLYQAFVSNQQINHCGNHVLAFIKGLICPKRYDDEVEFENDRSSINEILLYEGLEVNLKGEILQTSKAKTISEAKQRSSRLKQKIQGISIHPDIFQFCEEEWLKESYFHAILEISKSISAKLQEKSGFKHMDGAELVEKCLGLGKDKKPVLAFNTLENLSEESEHKGFTNFIKGFLGMYRNPKAHNPRMNEDTQIEAMIEVLVIASIIHRKLDKTYKTGFAI